MLRKSYLQFLARLAGLTKPKPQSKWRVILCCNHQNTVHPKGLLQPELRLSGTFQIGRILQSPHQIVKYQNDDVEIRTTCFIVGKPHFSEELNKESSIRQILILCR